MEHCLEPASFEHVYSAGSGVLNIPLLHELSLFCGSYVMRHTLYLLDFLPSFDIQYVCMEKTDLLLFQLSRML